MTIHKQEHDGGDPRTEYDLVDTADSGLIRITHDHFDATLPIGIGSAVYDPFGEHSGDIQYETNWLTTEQAQELVVTLNDVIAAAIAEAP